jgi:hypothetical protein
MNSLETRMRSANPIPDPRSDFSDDEVAALLTLIRARSTDMDMQELTRPVEPEQKSKPSWWIAAAAFAAVIVVVGAALLIGNATSSGPAATTPTTEAPPVTDAESAPPTTAETAPTTTVPASDADALTPAEEAFVAQFFEAFNGRDEAALLALASPDARFTSYVLVDASRDLWEQELAWRWAMEEQWTADSCKLAFSGISCQVTIEGGVFRYLESQEAVLRISLNDDVATSVTVTEDLALIIPETQELRAWLESEHPDQFDTLNATSDNPSPPRITDDAIAAWQELMPAFWAFREAGRP